MGGPLAASRSPHPRLARTLRRKRRVEEMAGILDAHAREILCRFPIAGLSGSPIALGNRGGFSGALLWRTQGDPSLCLRAWPPDAMTPHRLAELHAWMAVARRAGLHFVPTVYA